VRVTLYHMQMLILSPVVRDRTTGSVAIPSFVFLSLALPILALSSPDGSFPQRSNLHFSVLFLKACFITNIGWLLSGTSSAIDKSSFSWQHRQGAYRRPHSEPRCCLNSIHYFSSNLILLQKSREKMVWWISPEAICCLLSLENLLTVLLKRKYDSPGASKPVLDLGF
jgi:hypothetical protein